MSPVIARVGGRKIVMTLIGTVVGCWMFDRVLAFQLEIALAITKAKQVPPPVDWWSVGLFVGLCMTPVLTYLGVNVAQKWVQNGKAPHAPGS